MLIFSLNIFRYNLCCWIRVCLVILDVSRGLKRRPPSLAPFSPSELESNNKNSFLISLSQLEKKNKKSCYKKISKTNREKFLFVYGYGRIKIKERSLVNLKLGRKTITERFGLILWPLAPRAFPREFEKKVRPSPDRIPDKTLFLK